jgi:hypothetical protein
MDQLETPRRLRSAFCAVLLTALLGSAHAADMTFEPAFFASGYNANGIDFGGSTVGNGTTTRTNTIQPGDTIWLQANPTTRIRKVKLLNIKGTAAAPIRIRNTGGQWLINGDSATYADKGLILLGCQHVILEGQSGAGYDYGIKIDTTYYGDSVHRQAATGLVVGDIAATSTTPVVPSFGIEISGIEITNAGFAGIQVKNAGTPSTYVLNGLKIHHNYIHDVFGEGMYVGWTSSNHETMANVDIYDNIVRNVGWDGIQANYISSNGKIRDNLVEG